MSAAFQILGDPVKRRILELLKESELSSGEVVSLIQEEFGISQPAVSQHLKILRESGFASVTETGTRRIYKLDVSPLEEVDKWISPFRDFFDNRLRALHTEIERGKKDRKRRKRKRV